MPSAEFNHILYHNAAINNTNWIGFILEGTLSNRDAVGSIVTLYVGEKKQIRLHKCGNGFVRQDNPWIHFGIGFETGVDSVVIRWPLGYKQVLTDISINQYHNVKEPDYTSVDSKYFTRTKSAVFNLEQNYPNPFNPSTRIKFTLRHSTHIEFAIYDLTGREIKILVNKNQEAGQHIIDWDGRDNSGKIVSSGVYLYQIKSDDFIKSRKMIFIQ